MSWYSKVAWKEGLFLQPQHLQQSDRYLERLITARTDVITPYPWGLSEMTIDNDMLQQGRIGLRSVTGIMPDGGPFDAPSMGDLPTPVNVDDDAAGMSVWLTLPDISQNGRDVGLGEDAAATRYSLSSATIADNASATRIEHQIETAIPRLELDIRKSTKPGYQCLRIAKIAEIRDGVITLDTTVAPPALVVGVHPVIMGYLTRVIGWVEAKLESLARYAADPTAGGGMQATDYLMLMVLNREIAILRHYAKSHAVHPERMYEKLISFSGELSTFNDGDRMARDYGVYDHGDPKATFTPVVQDIQRLLARDVGRAVRLDLKQVRQNSYIAEVADRNLFRDATFVVEVEVGKPLTQVQQQFPQLCKLGPNTRMSEIVMNNLPGINLVHLPNPPRQIRVVSTNVYFLLEKNTALWQEFSTAPAIGMHFAGDWTDMKLELWAIPEKS